MTPFVKSTAREIAISGHPRATGIVRGESRAPLSKDAGAICRPRLAFDLDRDW
jgi:hypothetical protein